MYTPFSSDFVFPSGNLITVKNYPNFLLREKRGFLFLQGHIFSWLLLFCFSFLFYGCDSKKESDFSEKDSSPREAVEPQTVSDVFSEDVLADILGKTTDEFSRTFRDDLEIPDTKNDANINEQEQTTGESPEPAIDPEVRERLIRDNEPPLVPTLIQNSENKDDSQTKYRLQYKFEPNEQLHWKVTHQVRKKITYGGKTKAIETSSLTIRHWNIYDRLEDGSMRGEHLIDRMILEQQEEEKEPVRYDSEVDLVVPKEITMFGTEKTVKVILETFQVNALGVLSSKVKLIPEYAGSERDSKMLVPFPDAEIRIGDSWTIPYPLYLKDQDGNIRTYQAVQKFTLEKVNGSLATIQFKSILLSIVSDPVMEGQLAEKIFTGWARFDMDSGKIIHTEMDFVKSVTNAFGEPSHLEYRCHVVENLMRETTDTAEITTDKGTGDTGNESPDNGDESPGQDESDFLTDMSNATSTGSAETTPDENAENAVKEISETVSENRSSENTEEVGEENE